MIITCRPTFVILRLSMLLLACFSITNGVKQGVILSPFLFRFYTRNLIQIVTSASAGCTMFNCCFHLLAYADDLVILAPSWWGLQYLLNLLVSAAGNIGLSINAQKTVAMVFNPTDNRKTYMLHFRHFPHMLATSPLLHVSNT